MRAKDACGQKYLRWWENINKPYMGSSATRSNMTCWLKDIFETFLRLECLVTKSIVHHHFRYTYWFIPLELCIQIMHETFFFWFDISVFNQCWIKPSTTSTVNGTKKNSYLSRVWSVNGGSSSKTEKSDNNN